MTVQTLIHNLESTLEAERARVRDLRRRLTAAQDVARVERGRRELLRERIEELEGLLGQAKEQEHRDLLDCLDPGDGRLFVEAGAGRAEVA